MMGIKEVTDSLKTTLSSDFSKDGYRYFSGKGGAGFKKQTSFGFVELLYGITNYAPKYIVDGIAFAIRFDSVENIVVLFNQRVDEIADVKKQATIFGGYGGLINLKSHRFGDMLTIEDVQKVASEIKGIYFDVLKVFIEKHSDINLLDQEINSDTERNLPFLIYWRGRRAMRGIVLAKLCNNPRYEELKSIYREKCLQQDDQNVLEAYDKLVLYLDKELSKN
jgi:hypothetical protein